MSKITSKLQITIPKAIATTCGLGPGDELEFVVRGDELRLVSGRRARRRLTTAQRLALFDEASQRQRARDKAWTGTRNAAKRGWTRDELYGDRGYPR